MHVGVELALAPGTVGGAPNWAQKGSVAVTAGGGSAT